MIATIVNVSTHRPDYGPQPEQAEPPPIITRPPALPEPPTRIEMAANFAVAMARWGAAGFKTVNAEEYETRFATCEACEFWDGDARWGIGKCKHPNCGCGRWKAWLKTERCPILKW
jgi:hypothetical protein